MVTPPPPASPRAQLPRPLHECLVEMAIAVHKRSIYPPGHPILQGATEAVHARLAALLHAHTDLSLGVAERQFVVDGAAGDDANTQLSDFAARLSDHQVGAVRILPGVSREELDAFLEAAAASTDDEAALLGRRDDVNTPHVTIYPIAFERLGLLSQDSATAAPGHEDETWRALATAAMRGASVDGDAMHPRAVAAAIDAACGDDGFEQDVIQRLSRMLSAMHTASATVPASQQQRLSELISGMGERALTRLLEVGGRDQSTEVVRSAADVLGARAVLELVRAAASCDAVSVSGSMLRMLQKLSAHSELPGARGTEADRVLRMSVRKLLDGWTLENPNPEMYERVLEDASGRSSKRTGDQRRDVAEPERMVDLAIETEVVGPTAETALGRLAMRDGIAMTLERLQLYPSSPTREILVDRLINEAAVREYLAQEPLDVPLLRQAVDRMKGRAVAPLLVALERRPDADSAALIELLARVGWDVLEPLGTVLASAAPRQLRHLVAVFDRLDAWPPQADPASYASNPDFVVRREAIRYMLRADTTRDQGVLLALRDPDVRIVSLGLQAVSRECSPAAARLAMARYSDPLLAPELRVRAVRAAALSRHPEVLPWLGSLVVTRRWLLGSPRLRKPSPETIAAVAAITSHFPGTPLEQQVTQLSLASRVPEYRRAATRSLGASPS